MSAAETRQRILETSFRLLLAKGYDGVSISDLQKATGMSRGLLYHYFGSKDALFVEVTQQYLIDLFYVDSRKTQSMDLEELIAFMLDMYQGICETLFRVMQGEPEHSDDHATWESIGNYDFLFYRVMRDNEDFYLQYRKVRDEEERAWKQAVQNSLDLGKIRAGLDPEHIACCFSYLMDGVWSKAVTEKRIDAFGENLRDSLQHFYGLLL